MEQQDNNPATVDQQIDWILSHPYISQWLKAALLGARQRKPIDVLNDLEMLDCLLGQWCEASLKSCGCWRVKMHAHVGAPARGARSA